MVCKGWRCIIMHMKKTYVIIALIVLGAGAALVFGQSGASTPTAEALHAQLLGEKCIFEISDEGTPVERGMFGGMDRRNDAELCVIDAAKLLGAMHSQTTDTVPLLIDGLKSNHNVDTGDGIIPVRSEIASVLGQIGDKRAIPALEEILASEDPAIPSSHEAVRQALSAILQK